VHADGTSSQFAYFNSSNGQFVDNETYQGYSNTSTWARGEAWAIYGFAQVYADTGRRIFWPPAKRPPTGSSRTCPVTMYPIGFQRPEPTYRDTSAAAVAASGLLKTQRLDSHQRSD